jgi:hypothetical protein
MKRFLGRSQGGSGSRREHPHVPRERETLEGHRWKCPARRSVDVHREWSFNSHGRRAYPPSFCTAMLTGGLDQGEPEIAGLLPDTACQIRAEAGVNLTSNDERTRLSHGRRCVQSLPQVRLPFRRYAHVADFAVPSQVCTTSPCGVRLPACCNCPSTPVVMRWQPVRSVTRPGLFASRRVASRRVASRRRLSCPLSGCGVASKLGKVCSFILSACKRD